jgi:hypothetical protein
MDKTLADKLVDRAVKRRGMSWPVDVGSAPADARLNAEWLFALVRRGGVKNLISNLVARGPDVGLRPQTQRMRAAYLVNHIEASESVAERCLPFSGKSLAAAFALSGSAATLIFSLNDLELSASPAVLYIICGAALWLCAAAAAGYDLILRAPTALAKER